MKQGSFVDQIYAIWKATQFFFSKEMTTTAEKLFKEEISVNHFPIFHKWYDTKNFSTFNLELTITIQVQNSLINVDKLPGHKNWQRFVWRVACFFFNVTVQKCYFHGLVLNMLPF